MPAYLERVLRHAEREFVHQAHLRPTDLVDLYRRFFRVQEHLLLRQHQRGGDGREVARKRAEVISVMLRHIWNGAWETHKRFHPEAPPRIALIAVGGFGRGELNPYSDIDLLFLYPNDSQRSVGLVRDIVQHVLYLLWDVGFQVGHATRTLSELFSQANSDLRTKTALLEARFLIGDEALHREFEKTFDARCLHGAEKEYLEWRVLDQAERHAKYGHTPFLQEPNVKSACGGLRDYQNLLWIGRVKRGFRTLQQFVEAQLLTGTERKQLDRAYDYLLRLRTELHYQQKRSGDILTLRLQGQIANAFHLQHRTILRRTEALMRTYYYHASFLYNLSNLISARLCGGPRSQRPRWAFLPFRATKRQEFNGFSLENGELEALSATTFSDDPLRLVRVFLLAMQQDAELGAELKMRLRRRLYQVDRAYIHQTAVRDTLLAIFSRKGQVGPTLRTMHELGYLGRFFPEFRPLTCLVQHEFFHRYTADEHTLVCIEMLDRIVTATGPPFLKYQELMKKVSKPYILYLAMLLHDTGKSENAKRHAEASASNAVKVARRLHLTGTDLSTLVFLCDHHLTLSEIARRKNPESEETILELSAIVQTQERLDLLLLLTYADTIGTGSARSYSDWKDLLLWQFYHRTTAALSGVRAFVEGAEQARAAAQQRIITNLDRQFDPAEIAAHFENLPPNYLAATKEDLIRGHISLVHQFFKYQLTHDDASLQPVVHWRQFPAEGYSELMVVTWDRPFLAAHVTGALAASGLTILRAEIFTRRDDIAIETFFVATEQLTAVTDPRDVATFTKTLHHAFSDPKFDLAALLGRLRKTRVPDYAVSLVPTRVTIDQHAAQNYTLLDIVTGDYPGLLYRIAGAIAEAGINLSSAQITTEKGAALDTFYLTDRAGKKIESPTLLAQLTRRVQAAIEL